MISECPPSYILFYSMCLNVLLFLLLFVDFYRKSYLIKDKGVSKPPWTENGIICMSNMDEDNYMVKRDAIKNYGIKLHDDTKLKGLVNDSIPRRNK